MPRQILVVGDPPHGDVDTEAVASVLGLSAEDAAAKIRFPAPEVFKAGDWDRANQVAELLAEAGLRVVVVDGSELGRIPWPVRVQSLAFEQERLLARLPDATVELPYGMPLLGVSCRPPVDFLAGVVAELRAGADGGPPPEAVEWLPRLDLYGVRNGRLHRLSIVDDAPAAPDERAEAGLSDALDAVVAECARRFESIDLDTRLENLRPRRRFVPGDTSFDVDLRKLYSFGTLLLRHALETISHELRDVTHYEFGSRLAYVVHRHGDDAEGTTGR